MRRLILAVAVVACCSVAAADLTLTASGFPDGNPGNGTFKLIQQKNADGKLIDCWAQEGKEGFGWRAGYNDAAGLIRVTYQLGGTLIEYNAIIPGAPSGATVPLKGASPPVGTAPIPKSVKIGP